MEGSFCWTHSQDMSILGCLRDSAGRLTRGGGFVDRGWCPPSPPLPNSKWVLFQRRWHARGRRLCRRKPCKAPQHMQTYHITLKMMMSKYQIWRGRMGAQSSTSQLSPEPFRARVRGANWEVSEGLLITGDGLFFSCESQQGASNWQDVEECIYPLCS